MAERGRPPFEITDEILNKAESYAARGLNQQQIADALGIGISTLMDKKKEYEDFSEAIKRGKAKGIAHVANNLLKNVDNGNVTAQIFYLKCQAQWKETDVLEHTGKDGSPIQMETKKMEDAQNLLHNVLEEILSKTKQKGKDDNG